MLTFKKGVNDNDAYSLYTFKSIIQKQYFHINNELGFQSISYSIDCIMCIVYFTYNLTKHSNFYEKYNPMGIMLLLEILSKIKFHLNQCKKIEKGLCN